MVQNLKRLLCALTRRRRGSPVPEPARDAAVLDLRGRLLEEGATPSPLPGVSRRIRETHSSQWVQPLLCKFISAAKVFS